MEFVADHFVKRVSVFALPALVGFSFSLQLSLLAAFLMGFSTGSLKRAFFAYVFILPVINRWQALHPLTVLINWISVPVIGALLFPLSFVSPLFPPMYMLSDRLWAVALKILALAEFLPSKSPLLHWFVPDHFMWVYVGTVALMVFLWGF